LARTNLQEQETTLKQLISKRGDPELDTATIMLTDLLPEPRDNDVPEPVEAVNTAYSNRPELKEAVNNLQNQDIGIRYARNNMKPSLAVFGLYAGSGLQGNTITTTAGAGASLSQTFGAAFPETAYGLSFSAAIRNRSAQADSIRSQLERNQLEVGLQN